MSSIKEEQLESNSDSDGYLDEYVQLPPKPNHKKQIRIRKQAECVKCKKFKPIYGKQMCQSCGAKARKQLPDFNKPNIVCVNCQKTSKHHAKNMCKNCYTAKHSKKRRSNVIKHRECKGCKETKYIHAHDLCQKCYRHSTPKTKKECKTCGQIKILNGKLCNACSRKKRAKRMCHKCGIIKPIEGNNMCQECYNSTRKTDTDKHKECVNCKQVKSIEGFGMCMECYYQTRKEDTFNHKECVVCEQVKSIYSRGMCQACCSKIRRQTLENDKSRHKECIECEEVKPIFGREMCAPCYYRVYQKPKLQAKQKAIKKLKQAKKRILKATLTPKQEIKMELVD